MRESTLAALSQGAGTLIFKDADHLPFGELDSLFKEIDFSFFNAVFVLDSEDNREKLVEALSKISEINWVERCLCPIDQLSLNLNHRNEAVGLASDYLFTIFKKKKFPVLNIELSYDFFFDVSFGRAIGICIDQFKDECKSAINGQLRTFAYINQSESALEGEWLIANTTAIISAILGGYTNVINESKTLNDNRLYINIYHILREEAGLFRVSDPCAGSRHIEEMTNEIAQRIWSGFLQKIENLNEEDINSK